MGTLGKWLTGMIILGIVALLFELTPWGGSARSANMGESVQAALGAGSITSEMSGNVAKLTGVVKSEKAKLAAIATAQNAQCEKCGDRADGKRWHEVDGSGITVAKPVVAKIENYTLTGVRTEDGGIVLDGYVRTDAEKRVLIADAKRLFSGAVIDRTIKISPDAPNTSWLKVARANVAQLAVLDSGEFAMENLNSVIRGQASSEDIRTGVNAAVNGLPTAYHGAANIAVPNTAAVNTGQIKSQTICQELFESLKGDNKINFAYNRAEIKGAPSIALLNSISSAATQCSSFRIEVGGHTDADGSEAYNLDLSRRRAEAVRSYLVQSGVDASSVTGGGYGESRPIASNDTPQGMAKNRRIEFKITQSK